jgi:hypothetical protein
MSNQEWIQTADTNSLAGFLQEISCKHCSRQGKCNSGQDMDCFDSAYKWLKKEHKERDSDGRLGNNRT